MQYKKNLLALLAATALTTSLTQFIFAVPGEDDSIVIDNSAQDNQGSINNQNDLNADTSELQNILLKMPGYEQGVVDAKQAYDVNTTLAAEAKQGYKTAIADNTATAQEKAEKLKLWNTAIATQKEAFNALDIALEKLAQARADGASYRNKVAEDHNLVALDEARSSGDLLRQYAGQIDSSQPANVNELNKAEAGARVAGNYAQRFKDRFLVAKAEGILADLEKRRADKQRDLANAAENLKIKLEEYAVAVSAMTGKTGSELTQANTEVSAAEAALSTAKDNFTDANDDLAKFNNDTSQAYKQAKTDAEAKEEALGGDKAEEDFNNALELLDQIHSGTAPVGENTVDSSSAALATFNQAATAAAENETASKNTLKDKMQAVEDKQAAVVTAEQIVTQKLNSLIAARKLKTDSKDKVIEAQKALKAWVGAKSGADYEKLQKAVADAKTEDSNVQDPSTNEYDNANATLKATLADLALAKDAAIEVENILASHSTEQAQAEISKIKNRYQLAAAHKKEGNTKEAQIHSILAQHDSEKAKNEAKQAENQIKNSAKKKLLRRAEDALIGSEEALLKAKDESFKAELAFKEATIALNDDTANSAKSKAEIDAKKALDEAKAKETSAGHAFSLATTKVANAKADVESTQKDLEFDELLIANQGTIERQKLENTVSDLVTKQQQDVEELKSKMAALKAANPEIAQKEEAQSQIDKLKQLAPVAFPKVKEMTAEHPAVSAVVESVKSLITQGTISSDDPRMSLIAKLIKEASNDPEDLAKLDLSVVEQGLKEDSRQIQARVDVVNDAIRANTSVVSNRLVDQIANANLASGENDKVGGGAWMQVIGSTGELKGTKTLQNFTSKALGMVVGADYKIKNLTVGIFGGVNLSFVTNSNNTANKDNMTSYVEGVYLNLEASKNLALSAIAGASQTQLSGEKEKNLLGQISDITKTKLDPNANSYFADIRVKYSLKFKDSLSLVPTVGYKVYKNDAFKYTSGGMIETSFDAATNHYLVAGANMIVSSLEKNSYRVTPEFHVFGEISMNETKNNVNSNFFTGANSPLVNETRDNASLLNVGGSLTVVNGKKEFSAGLDWNSRADYNGFVGRLNVRINL